MFHLQRRIRLQAVTLAVACVAALAPASLPAQEVATANATEPVVVVSLASIDKLTQDVNYIASVVGNAQAAQAGGMFSVMARSFTNGIDPTRPIGVIVPLVNQTPQPIALVPTDDVKSVLKRLEAQTGGPADELEDGTLLVIVGASEVYIRQAGPWAIVAPQRELLDLAPADPSTVFEGMGNDFDLAFRLRLQQVPADLRSMLTAQIRQGFEQAMEQQQNAESESAREMAETQLQQLQMLLEQADELAVGINVDQAGKQVALEGSFTAVPGSDLAAMYGGQAAIPSRFSSVIRDDAAAYYHAATSISPAAVKQTRAALETYLKAMDNAIAGESDLSSEQKVELTAMIERIADLAMASIEEGKADVGALLLADPSKFQFVFGAFVADGDEAAELVKELAEKVENEPNAPTFKFDQSTYKGVTMHLVEAEVPEKQDEARKIFGETLQLHVGTGDKVVYAAIGENSQQLMQELIDAGEGDNVGDRPVGQFKLSLLPILQYAQSIETNETLSAMIDSLSRAPDAGNVRVISRSIDNGAKTRVTIGEGILQAVGAAIRQNQQAAANQF